jgi:FtsZ-binding cell division protein ZapB
VSSAYKESSQNAAELKESLTQTTQEKDQANHINDHLNEQNNKLKEESASLITGIHSLKQSNMMLQDSVRDLADKLARRDKEIERLKEKFKILDHEHKVTLEQVKKLTKYIPETALNHQTPQKSKKDLKPFANLLL